MNVSVKELGKIQWHSGVEEMIINLLIHSHTYFTVPSLSVSGSY